MGGFNLVAKREGPSQRPPVDEGRREDGVAAMDVVESIPQPGVARHDTGLMP